MTLQKSDVTESDGRQWSSLVATSRKSQVFLFDLCDVVVFPMFCIHIKKTANQIKNDRQFSFILVKPQETN